MEVLACHQQPTLSQRSPSLLSRLSTLLKDSHPTTPRLPEKARRLLPPPPLGTSRQDNGVNNSRAFTPWMKAAHVSLKRDVRIFPKKHPRYMQMSVPASTRILATFVSLSLSLSCFYDHLFPKIVVDSRDEKGVGLVSVLFCQRCLADFTAGIKRDENRDYIKGRDEFDFDSFPNARLFCTKLFQLFLMEKKERRGLEAGGPERWMAGQ